MKNHIFSGSTAGLNVVAIGGGNGLSTLLSGLKGYVGRSDGRSAWIDQLSAIVAVTDDGGSSGRLRDELNMPPPGDIRNCMVALSEDSKMLSKLFRHRFSGDGDLGGHSFGNIFLAALSEVTGDFAEAVKLSNEILAIKGTIYPATASDVRLAAELKSGKIVRGETKISHVGTAIRQLFLEPSACKPLPEAIDAIADADIITVGPGSLFTSLIPPILVPGIADAISRSKAVKVFICNLMTQPGETDGMSSLKHLEHFRSYGKKIEFDHILVNDHPISETQAEKYADEGAQQIGIRHSLSASSIGGADIVYGNLLDDSEMVRHHPDKLARAVMACALVPNKTTAAETLLNRQDLKKKN